MLFARSQVYKDAAAQAFHREQAHYKAWADFKAEGGVESQVRAFRAAGRAAARAETPQATTFAARSMRGKR